MATLVMESPSAHMLMSRGGGETVPRSNSLKMSKGHVLGGYHPNTGNNESLYSEEN